MRMTLFTKKREEAEKPWMQTTNSTPTVKAKMSRLQPENYSNGSFQNHHIYKSQLPTLCVLLFE